MIDQALKALRAPRLWLSASVVCFATWILLGYHQDQIAADSVLAEKVSYPSKVMIQDYDPGRHSNILREVHVLAEADLSRAIRQTIPSSGAARTIEIVPVFPVSRISAPLAATLLRGDGPRRPRGRADAQVVEREMDAMRAIETTPVGLIVSEGSVSDDLIEIGEGLNGPLVTLLGAEIGNGDVFDQAAQTFADGGISLLSGIPVVWLYPKGSRPVAALEDFTALRNVLLSAAVILALAGGVLAFVAANRKDTGEMDDAFEEVAAVGDFPGVFVPIHNDREERIRAEQDASERRAAQTRRVLSRVVSS